MDGFILAGPSKAKLAKVHPRLEVVVRRALVLSRQDFTVFEGLRSPETQAAYVLRGVSWTNASKHLRQTDGYSHAVDLVPWVGKAEWDWELIYPIAWAMREAARELGVGLRWGGVWDRALGGFEAKGPADMKKAVLAYNARHKDPDRPDGPHYELLDNWQVT